jgi:hypothetical protein
VELHVGNLVLCGLVGLVWVVLSVTMEASRTEALKDNPEENTNRNASQLKNMRILNLFICNYTQFGAFKSVYCTVIYMCRSCLGIESTLKIYNKI